MTAPALLLLAGAVTATSAAAPSAPAPAVPAVRYTIAVGYNESTRADRPALRFADDDAAKTYELLAPGAARSWLLTAFDRESQATFTELVQVAETPTRAVLDAALAGARRRIAADRAAGRRTVLHFYYAGHGDIEDGEGYVNLADGRLYRKDFVPMLLDGTRADRTHVIIDACKSYHLVSGRGPGGRRTPTTAGFAGPARRPGVGYVLSTSSDNDAHEWSAFGGGVFSHEVRSALAGAADVDLDGEVDYEELAAFVAVANERLRFPRFVPDVFIRAPAEDARAAIFAPSRVPSVVQLEMDERDSGRVTLVDERGLRYADFNKAPDRRVRLALVQPRRYGARWGARSYTIARGAGTTVRLAELPSESDAVAARGELHRAFEDLFEAPLSADVLRGYRLAGPRAIVEPPPEAAARSLAAPVVLIGGGLAAIAGGAVFAVLAGNTKAEAAAAPQAHRPGLVDEADRMTLGAAGAWGLGAGAIGAGLYLLLSE